MSVNSKMTAIANKIRNLLGITGSMGLDDMSENLDACIDEVSTQSLMIDQALLALDNKVGAGSGGVAGSLPVGISKLATGTILNNEDSLSDGLYRIEHGLGVAPNFYMICMSGAASGAEHAGYLCMAYGVRFTAGNVSSVENVYTVTSSGDIYKSDSSYNEAFASAIFNDTQFIVNLDNRPLKANTTYIWVCGVIDGIE